MTGRDTAYAICARPEARPHHRVRRMVIEPSDLRGRLAPHVDPEVAGAAERGARRADLSGRDLSAGVEAARLAEAFRSWRAGSPAVGTAVSPSRGDLPEDAGEGLRVDGEID